MHKELTTKTPIGHTRRGSGSRDLKIEEVRGDISKHRVKKANLIFT
jgi:hypothetical protein